MNNKIGIGIITCEREDYLNTLLDSIDKNIAVIDKIVVVDDGFKKTIHTHPNVDFIKHTTGKIGVGKAKNEALKYLLEQDCDYIFLIEDDMIILDQTVFKQYINVSKKTGIQHFNFGPGSPFNRKQTIQNFDLHNRHELKENSKPNPRIIFDYNDCKIALYTHITGMFSFFTKEVLDKVGFIDEDYKNAWEHVDHTNRIIKAGYHPPFWWFADIDNSINYISSQKDAIQNSTTSKNTTEWLQNVQTNAELYKRKNGCYPSNTINVPQEQVIKFLKTIKP